MAKMIDMVCPVCGKGFQREEWRIKQAPPTKVFYCSISCAAKVSTKKPRPGAQRKVTLTCHHCGREFQRKPSDASDRTRQFCNRYCWVAWTKTEEGKTINIGYID